MRLISLAGLSPLLLYLASARDAHAAPFSPEDMLATPRPHPAIASSDGHHALSVVDTWDPKHDSTTRTIYLLSLNTSSTDDPIQLLASQPGHASELFWLDEGSFAYLNGTELWVYDVSRAKALWDSSAVGTSKPKPILRFPEGVNPTGLQYQRDTGALVFSGQVWANGDFASSARGDEAWEKRGTSGVVFDELFIRHWDTWRIPGKVWTIGVTHLDVKSLSSTVSKPSFINLLNSTRLTSQSDPHGSVAVSKDHIAFTVKPPHLNFARHTREDVYVLPLPRSTPGYDHVQPNQITPHEHGAISSVKFSPDGKKIAWLEMAEDGYESDKRVVVVYHLGKNGQAGTTERWTDAWDRSPSALEWSLDSASLYFTAEHEGRVLPYHLTHADHLPTPLLFAHTTGSITPLHNSSLLLSIANFTSPSNDFILDLGEPDSPADDGDKLPTRHLHRLTDWSSKHIAGRLDRITIEEMWTTGAEEWPVHSWVLLPPGFKNDSKAAYPLAFFVHGGPQGAWEDSWSTRWNPALFAARGYMVVAVNPTGSTGYGQEFCDRIKENWGGAPFKDLLASYQAALKEFPQIDPERTAMLGASYGGYMANWIQGHNDQFGFKAIVCHDGIFDTTSAYYETEEVWFPQREFGGDPTQTRATFEKWNPMNHVAEWKTPELVIHGGKDYRLVDGQGIAAFTALQVQGVPSRFLYFPDENHWVLKPSNSKKWHHEVFKWIDEWTGESKVRSEDALESVGRRPELVLQA